MNKLLINTRNYRQKGTLQSGWHKYMRGAYNPGTCIEAVKEAEVPVDDRCLDSCEISAPQASVLVSGYGHGHDGFILGHRECQKLDPCYLDSAIMGHEG